MKRTSISRLCGCLMLSMICCNTSNTNSNSTSTSNHTINITTTNNNDVNDNTHTHNDNNDNNTNTIIDNTNNNDTMSYISSETSSPQTACQPSLHHGCGGKLATCHIACDGAIGICMCICVYISIHNDICIYDYDDDDAYYYCCYYYSASVSLTQHWATQNCHGRASGLNLVKRSRLMIIMPGPGQFLSEKGRGTGLSLSLSLALSLSLSVYESLTL